MALFKKYSLQKILEGRKTQTRRIHKHTWQVGKVYALRDRWFSKPQAHIIVTRKYRQKLGEISLEDVQKEGFSSLEEFRREWERLYGKWNPEQVVWVYEFKLVPSSKTDKLLSEAENRTL